MEINVYRRRNSIPGTAGGVPISPDKVAEPYIAEAQQGAAVSRLGFQSAELNNQYLAAEKRAERVVASQRLELALDEDFTTAKLESQSEEDAKQRIDAIRANRVDSIADPIVKRAVEMAWAKRANDLRVHARTEKIKALTTESNNMYEADYVRAIDSYARETDPVKQAVIKDTLQIKGLELEAAKVRQPGTTERKMLQFDKDAGIVRDAYARDAKAAEAEKQKAIKEQQTIARENANKELVDINVAGKLSYSTLLKYRSVLDDKEYKSWAKTIEDNTEKAKKAATEGNGVFKTDKSLEGKIYRQIVKDPESITDAQIADYIGNGLSRTSAEGLITDKRQRIKGDKDPARDAAEKAVIENLKRDRKAGVFGEDQSGDLEYAKQIDSFRRWSKAHPDDDPSDYYEKLIEPVKRSFVFDFLAKDKPDPKGKREAMEKAGEIPGRKGSKKPDPLGIR